MSQTHTRIAIVDADLCQSTKCRKECQRYCPVNQTGKECVTIVSQEVEGKSRDISQIVEATCIGCGGCVSKCPFKAITIVNLPKALSAITYKYGVNLFQIHNLPMPKRGSILGLIGANGVGKTTCLQVLRDHVRPNFGQLTQISSPAEIIKYYRGSDLQNYFRELYQQKLIVSFKPQSLPNHEGIVKDHLMQVSDYPQDHPFYQSVWTQLTLKDIESKVISKLSGGQAQRLAIAQTLLKTADVYIFDEPSSYLDIRQRLAMAETIRQLLTDKYVIVVEHDLSVLDYLSDRICLLYGQPSAYGIVSVPYLVREGINMFLDGYISAENMRFRADSLNFKFGIENETSSQTSSTSPSPTEGEVVDVIYTDQQISYPDLTKTYDGFSLQVSGGSVRSSEINVLVGANGTGKTTLIQMLCGLVKPDGEVSVPVLNVSYKPQIITPKFEGSVEELLYNRIGSTLTNQQFRQDVVNPLKIDALMKQSVKSLSGGQLQRVAIVLALGKPADIYLIDEPSAYLDIEQRLAVAKVIKRFIMNTHKYCFLVEHDFIMSTYLANRVIVFDIQGQTSTASVPYEVVEGFNTFLKIAGVTFRRDTNTYRPRINKLHSQNDQIQKASDQYFIFDQLPEVQKSFALPEHKLDW